MTVKSFITLTPGLALDEDAADADVDVDDNDV